MLNIQIRSTGKYLPRKIVTSAELDTRLDKRKGWSEKKSGIKHRHFASGDESSSVMAARAAKQALDSAGMAADELDCIIGACGVMQQAIPSTAVLVQYELGLGLSGIPAFDINSTCLSFLTALNMAAHLIANKQYKNILIFSSDIASVGLNWEHTESATLFGDGAAAMIISEVVSENISSILNFELVTYGVGKDICRILGCGTQFPVSTLTEEQKATGLFEMDGKAAYKFTANYIDEFVDKLLTKANLSLSEIDWVVPHQASKLAMLHIAKKLKINNNKMISIIETHGNQIATSLPTALHEAIITNKLQKGQRVLMLGMAAGISFGGMVIEY